MREERPAEITDVHVRSLATKLEGLRALLSPPECVLLRTVLSRAAGREEGAFGDVRGFAWRTTSDPFEQLAAIDFEAPSRQDPRMLLRRRLGEFQ